MRQIVTWQEMNSLPLDRLRLGRTTTPTLNGRHVIIFNIPVMQKEASQDKNGECIEQKTYLGLALEPRFDGVQVEATSSASSSEGPLDVLTSAGSSPASESDTAFLNVPYKLLISKG